MRQTTALVRFRFFVQFDRRDGVGVQTALAINPRARKLPLKKSEQKQSNRLAHQRGKNEEEMNAKKANKLDTVERVQPFGKWSRMATKITDRVLQIAPRPLQQRYRAV